MADDTKKTDEKPAEPPPVLYPAWRYHATETARIVNSKDEDDKLGDGWVDAPDKVKKAKPASEHESESKAPESSKPADSPRPPHRSK